MRRISTETQVFSSKSEIKDFFELLKSIFVSIPTSLRMGWTLGYRDFVIHFKGSLLGFTWAVISPLLYAVLMIFVKGGGLLGSEAMDHTHALYLITGFSLYQIWMETLLDQLETFRHERDLITKMKLPTETFFYATMSKSMINLGIRTGLIFLIHFALLGLPGPSALLFPIFAFGAIFSAAVIGFVLSPISALFKDVRSVIQSLSLAILFVTPVFYSPSTDPQSLLYKANLVNPLAAFLCSARDSLLGTPYTFLGPTLVWVAVCIVVFVVQQVVMRISTPLLVERMGN